MTALMLYALQFCKSLQNVFAPLSVAHFDGKRKKKKERKITIKRFAVGWIHFVVFYFLLQRTWRTFQKHFSLATRMRQEFFPSIFFAFLRSPEADCQLPSGGSPFPQNPILYAGISLPFPAKMIEFDALAASIACKFCYYSHCFCSLQLKCHFRSTLRCRQINMLIL